jgi:methionyl-tRNA formyltransferase
MRIGLVGSGYIYDAAIKGIDKRDLVDHNADLLILAGYPRILKEDEIKLMPLGVINIHTSLLPNYRGRHPVDWAMENKEKEIGITIYYVDKGIDTGDIIIQDSVPYVEGEGYDSVVAKLVDKIPAMVSCVVKQIELGCAYRRRQNESVARYYPKRTKPRIY